MGIIIAVIIIGALIVCYELPPLMKSKSIREIIVFFILLIPGLSLFIMINQGMTPPSPLRWLINIFNPITQYIHRILT